jgi:hypothetical protein
MTSAPSPRRPSVSRVLIGALGVAVAVRGVWMLLANQRFDQLFSAALWLGGGVLAHDAIIAPVALGLGWVLIRALPAWARGAAAAGGIVLGSLTLVAVPVLGAWGRRPDNASLLPRDYLLGWLAVFVVIIICSTAAALIVRARRQAGR